jgi:hypothetical protein
MDFFTALGDSEFEQAIDEERSPQQDKHKSSLMWKRIRSPADGPLSNDSSAHRYNSRHDRISGRTNLAD